MWISTDARRLPVKLQSDLPVGAFTSKILSTRAILTFTPRAAFSSLLQYNSSTHTVSTNARLRWEYHPGSEFFIVYNEERDSDAATGLPSLFNPSLIVKVNRLFRF